MSMFDELMKNEEYRKIFDKFPDDQKPLMIERMKTLMEETENKLLIPLQGAIEQLKVAMPKK